MMGGAIFFMLFFGRTSSAFSKHRALLRRVVVPPQYSNNSCCQNKNRLVQSRVQKSAIFAAAAATSRSNEIPINKEEKETTQQQQQTALLWLAHNRLRLQDNLALTRAAELGPDGLTTCIIWPYDTTSSLTSSIQVTPVEAFGYASVHAMNDALSQWGQKIWVIPSFSNKQGGGDGVVVGGQTTTLMDSDSDEYDPVNVIAQVVTELKPSYVVVDVSSLDIHCDNVSKLRKKLEEGTTTNNNTVIVHVNDDGLLVPFGNVPKALGRSRQGGRALRWSTFLSNAMMKMKTKEEEDDEDEEFIVETPNWSSLVTLPPIIENSDEILRSYGGAVIPPPMEGLSQWTQQLLSEWGEITEKEAMVRASSRADGSYITLMEDDDDSSTSFASHSSTSQLLTERGSKDTKLSPYLRWGIISPQRAAQVGVRQRDLLWRDWSYICYRLLGPLRRGDAVLDILDTSCCNYNNNSVKSSDDEEGEEDDDSTNRFHLWCVGNTGCQLVDAGMRQLWFEGWIPRRIRLLVAGCLVEGMGVHWKLGRDWFEYTLIDHDPAINEVMWQNAGLCGVDPFYKGIKWEAPPKGDDDEKYVQYWLSKELVWPTSLQPYVDQKPTSQFVDTAETQRHSLFRRGIYKAATTVRNSGVRVAWPGLRCSTTSEGEVMGVGLVPVKDLTLNRYE